MWQKLNRIDTYELEKARIQLQNAIQLVSAAPRSYIQLKSDKKDWLKWNSENASLESIPFGAENKVKLALDIEQFVLSLYGGNSHIEHLVLSGITYPMAFGWLKVKLDAFSLDADLYNDDTTYEIEHAFNSDDELNVSSQQVFGDLLIYYSNAFNLFLKLNEGLDFQGTIAVDPATMNMVLAPKKSVSNFNFGFSPGDKLYPEPYYFIKLDKSNDEVSNQVADLVGIWNSKGWKGLVLLASEFLTLNPDDEVNKVSDFFNKNYWRLFTN